MKQEEAEDLQKKIMSAKFDFNDFLKQTRAVAQMGSMSRVIGMIPGMGKVIFSPSLSFSLLLSLSLSLSLSFVPLLSFATSPFI